MHDETDDFMSPPPSLVAESSLIEISVILSSTI